LILTNGLYATEQSLEHSESRRVGVETLQLSDVTELKATTLSSEEQQLQSFLEKEYTRALLTRFINVCPNTTKLAPLIGRTPPTISKLKKPEVYGELNPTAKILWEWLQSNGVKGLEKELELSLDDIRGMIRSLEYLDLSSQNIVYDDLGDDISSDAASSDSNPSRPYCIRDVVSYLKKIKGTFKKINLSRNILSDEGLLVLVSELKDHDELEEIDLRENMISDIGLRNAKDLLKLPKLRVLYLSGNYGPSEETITELISWAKEEEQGSLRAKIK
jgi:hypothetical protein